MRETSIMDNLNCEMQANVEENKLEYNVTAYILC